MYSFTAFFSVTPLPSPFPNIRMCSTGGGNFPFPHNLAIQWPDQWYFIGFSRLTLSSPVSSRRVRWPHIESCSLSTGHLTSCVRKVGGGDGRYILVR